VLLISGNWRVSQPVWQSLEPQDSRLACLPVAPSPFQASADCCIRAPPPCHALAAQLANGRPLKVRIAHAQEIAVHSLAPDWLRLDAPSPQLASSKHSHRPNCSPRSGIFLPQMDRKVLFQLKLTNEARSQSQFRTMLKKPFLRAP